MAFISTSHFTRSTCGSRLLLAACLFGFARRLVHFRGILEGVFEFVTRVLGMVFLVHLGH